MYCKKCGFKIPDGAKFCNECGAPAEISVTKPSLIDHKTDPYTDGRFGLTTMNVLAFIFTVYGIINWIFNRVMNGRNKITDSMLKGIGIAILIKGLMALSIVISIINAFASSAHFLWILLTFIIPVVLFILGLAWVIWMSRRDFKKIYG